MSILFGIDIGTTKICIAAFDADTGRLTDVRYAANDTYLPGETDASEQDVSSISDRVFNLLKEVAGNIGNTKKIDAIGITGQMHGVLLASPDGHPITPLINWQDQRGNRQYHSTNHTITDEVRHRLGDAIPELTGASSATGYGAVTLFRLADNQEIPVYASAYTIHDYLVKQLTGASVTDPTDAASWGIYDVQRGTGWLPGIEEQLGFSANLLPDIHPASSIVGYLLPENASRIGLLDGIPVAVAMGDNQASFLGSVPSITESVLFNVGTGGQMSVSLDKYVYTKGLETRPLVTGKWLQVGASLCGGSAFRILADFFNHVGSDLFGVTLPLDALYEKMTSIANSIKTDDSPTIMPYFLGTRTDVSATAQISKLSASNFTPAHLSRAMICAIANELIEYYDMSEC